MQLIKLSSVLFIVVTMCSCSVKRNEIPDIYVAINQINNIDTLRILDDGTYKKNVYRKIDNSLIYQNSGNWDYKDGRITLRNFFYDQDKSYSKEFDNFEQILITSSFVIEKRSGKLAIEYLEDKGHYRYEKQE